MMGCFDEVNGRIHGKPIARDKIYPQKGARVPFVCPPDRQFHFTKEKPRRYPPGLTLSCAR